MALKRPPTSGTRHGNGASAYGSAGPAKPFTAASETRVNPADRNSDAEAQAYRAGQQSKSWHRKQRLDELADKAVEALEVLVASPAHPKHFEAAKETLNRADGMPVQVNVNRNTDDVRQLSDAELMRIAAGEELPTRH